MSIIGYSTGSLAYGDHRKALKLIEGKSMRAIELSALRESELLPLLKDISNLKLDEFEFISFHAPSKLVNITESEVVEHLKKLLSFNFYIVVHPDIITDFSLWKVFGNKLCIENMDKRKHSGRTLNELIEIFTNIPEASFCFDLAHCRQVDPTMLEAQKILYELREKLVYIHMSEVNSISKHEPMSLDTVMAYRKISHLIPETTPIILESTVAENEIESEIVLANLALNRWATKEKLTHIGKLNETKNKISAFFSKQLWRDKLNTSQFFYNKQSQTMFDGKIYLNQHYDLDLNVKTWKCQFERKIIDCTINIKDTTYTNQFFTSMIATIVINQNIQLQNGKKFSMYNENTVGNGFIVKVID